MSNDKKHQNTKAFNGVEPNRGAFLHVLPLIAVRILVFETRTVWCGADFGFCFSCGALRCGYGAVRCGAIKIGQNNHRTVPAPYEQQMT